MICEKYFRVKKNGETNKCYCTRPELIENYNLAIADKEQTWECHHRMEKYFPMKTLKAIGWYYDCEPSELIFLTIEEHNKLHHIGKTHSEETKQKMSETLKGREAWNKGKTHSEETKRKISEANKKRVLCVETGVIYGSITEAEHQMKCRGSISKVCRGERKTANGFHWQFV